MTIAVTCGSCQATFRVKDEHAGKRGKCPRCQAAVEVPAPRGPEPKDAAVPRPAAGAPQERLLREILGAFQGDIQPVRRTAGYAVGALILTVAMLVLPALYLALIAGIGYLLYYHATTDLAPVTAMRNWWALLFLYIGPLVVGAVLLFFMVKPLFARRSRAEPLRTLEFGEEPLLFALVTRVAQAVGAPQPKRIAVDCQANASAGFGSALGVLLGGDLVLTLGLPLVAGLNTRQLAGVIAHELGHFSQGAGMRLSYVVRSVNAWFWRLVYERDDWDEALVRGCEEGDRLAIFLYLALLCVWLTRCALWVLMALGHGLSCFMLRQMEYDADRYETRLAGTEAFAQTARQLLLLDLATSGALALAESSWRKAGRLPDDLIELVVTIGDSIPPAEFRKVEKDMERRKAGLFDTHPAHGERLAAARRENAPGVFHREGPATQLFKDFPRLSRAVTRAFYRQVIGKRAARGALVPVSAVLGGKAQEGAGGGPGGASL
jgi:Zn-dependent protease with chaperone function